MKNLFPLQLKIELEKPLSIELKEGENVIGYESVPNIKDQQLLQNLGFQKQHLNIIIEKNDLSLIDLDSKNGTFKQTQYSIQKLKNDKIYELQIDQYIYINDVKCRVINNETESKQKQTKKIEYPSVSQYFNHSVKRSSLVQEQERPTKVQKNLNNQIKDNKNINILISGLTLDQKQIKILKDCKVKICSINENYQYLIMDQYFRSIKFLYSINKGIQILSFEFLEFIFENKKIPQINNFLFKCEDEEKKYGFKLSQSIKSAQKSQFLQGQIFQIDKDINPSYQEIKLLIESAGGQVQESKNRSKIKTIIQIINEDQYQDQEKTIPNTYLFECILRQKFELQN